MRRTQHWIDGGWDAGTGDDGVVATNPANREPVALVARGTAAEIDRAVQAARRAQPEWADAGPIVRGRAMRRLADLIREHQSEFAEAERAEIGSSLAHAASMVLSSADYFDMYAGMARALRGETLDVGASRHAFTRREPYGVIGVITPWNAPLNQAARAAAPALAVGNAVVIKPSELTSSTTLLLASFTEEAGFPPGIVNVVTGTGVEVGEPLVRHPGIGKITFTGSVATGRRIASLAGERILPLTLELGGKSANIVFADVDVAKVAASIVRGSISQVAGQACSTLSRLLVERSLHDELVERVVDGFAELVPGETLPPMITEAQYEKVLSYFEIAEQEGAKCVVGGHALTGAASRGRYVPATVYTGVTNDMRIAREEVFGPVLCVIPFDDEAEAIGIANDTPYGLVGAVWTNDGARALRVAARLEAGQVAVNGGRMDNDTPFGGYKESGYGREKGFEALLQYTHLKTVSISTVS